MSLVSTLPEKHYQKIIPKQDGMLTFFPSFLISFGLTLSGNYDNLVAVGQLFGVRWTLLALSGVALGLR